MVDKWKWQTKKLVDVYTIVFISKKEEIITTITVFVSETGQMIMTCITTMFFH